MMAKSQSRKLSLNSALRLEFGIIGLGIVALIMIFQPFSLAVFSAGCGLVVVAALANNLLPLAEPGTPVRSILFAVAVVLFIFCTALIVSIVTAHLYGMVFLKAPTVSLLAKVPAKSFWQHPLFWSIVVADLILWVVVYRLAGKEDGSDV